MDSWAATQLATADSRYRTRSPTRTWAGHEWPPLRIRRSVESEIPMRWITCARESNCSAAMATPPSGREWWRPLTGRLEPIPYFLTQETGPAWSCSNRTSPGSNAVSGVMRPQPRIPRVPSERDDSSPDNGDQERTSAAQVQLCPRCRSGHARPSWMRWNGREPSARFPTAAGRSHLPLQASTPGANGSPSSARVASAQPVSYKFRPAT